MNWLELAKLLSSLALAIVQILARPGRSGDDPVEPAALPASAREKLAALADQVRSA